MSLYTKTALKKVKKDELIQMFLEQQAQMNDMKMDEEKLKAELDDVKEENEGMKLAILEYWEKGWETGDEYKKENEKLKEQINQN